MKRKKLASIVAVSLLTCLNANRYSSTFLAKFNRYNSKHTRLACCAEAINDTETQGNTTKTRYENLELNSFSIHIASILVFFFRSLDKTNTQHWTWICLSLVRYCVRINFHFCIQWRRFHCCCFVIKFPFILLPRNALLRTRYDRFFFKWRILFAPWKYYVIELKLLGSHEIAHVCVFRRALSGLHDCVCGFFFFTTTAVYVRVDLTRWGNMFEFHRVKKRDYLAENYEINFKLSMKMWETYEGNWKLMEFRIWRMYFEMQ